MKISNGLVSSDNYVAKEISSSKARSLLYHTTNNLRLRKQFLASGDQYRMSFYEWKRKTYRNDLILMGFPKSVIVIKSLDGETRMENYHEIQRRT